MDVCVCVGVNLLVPTTGLLCPVPGLLGAPGTAHAQRHTRHDPARCATTVGWGWGSAEAATGPAACGGLGSNRQHTTNRVALRCRVLATQLPCPPPPSEPLNIPACYCLPATACLLLPACYCLPATASLLLPATACQGGCGRRSWCCTRRGGCWAGPHCLRSWWAAGEDGGGGRVCHVFVCAGGVSGRGLGPGALKRDQRRMCVCASDHFAHLRKVLIK